MKNTIINKTIKYKLFFEVSFWFLVLNDDKELTLNNNMLYIA